MSNVTPMDEMKKLCICEPCPSYTECMRTGPELLFCVTGKSAGCMFDRKGCICPTCAVKTRPFPSRKPG